MAKPEGVRIHRADGTVLEAELFDDGIDENGVHNWIIANAMYQVGDHVTVAVLPGMTSVKFAANIPPGVSGTVEFMGTHSKKQFKRKWRWKG